MASFSEKSIQSLNQAKLFKGLTDYEIRAMLVCFKEETFAPNSMLVKQSDTEDTVYVIVEGTVEVVIDLIGSAKEGMIASLGEGDSVGEFALVGNARRSATAKAKSPVRAAGASAQALTDFFNTNPHIGYVVFRNMSTVLVERLINLNMYTRTVLSQYK